MFWDNVAWIYDIFANVINRKANKELCIKIEKLINNCDDALECACGTGLLTGTIARHCKNLIATDFSLKMLEKAKSKYKKYNNIRFEQADILNLPYQNDTFDTIVAANVIHLLDQPYQALSELNRVCKSNGKIIIPTYINRKDNGKTNTVSNAIDKVGADLRQKFTLDTYKNFFTAAGYKKVDYIMCDGRIPCAIAVISKK